MTVHCLPLKSVKFCAGFPAFARSIGTCFSFDFTSGTFGVARRMTHFSIVFWKQEDRKSENVPCAAGSIWKYRWIADRHLNSPTRWCGGWETEALIHKESQRVSVISSSWPLFVARCFVAFGKGSRTRKALLWANRLLLLPSEAQLCLRYVAGAARTQNGHVGRA